MSIGNCDQCSSSDYTEKFVDQFVGKVLNLCDFCSANENICSMNCSSCDVGIINDGLFTNNKSKCFCLPCTKYLIDFLELTISNELHLRYLFFPDDELFMESSNDLSFEKCLNCNRNHPIPTTQLKDGIRNHKFQICYFDGEDYNTIEFLNEIMDIPKYKPLQLLLNDYHYYLLTQKKNQ